MATTMTVSDWLDLMEAAQDMLRAQQWHFDPVGMLRNRLDQCPMCALASVAGTSRMYRAAANLAIRDAYGLDTPTGGISMVMDIADGVNGARTVHAANYARLLTILGVQA